MQPFRFSDDQLAYTVEDLARLCEQLPTDSINDLMREDFEKWLDYIGRRDLAQSAMEVRQAAMSDQERLKQFINSCQLPLGKGFKPSEDSQSSQDTKDTNPQRGLFDAIGNFFFGKR